MDQITAIWNLISSFDWAEIAKQVLIIVGACAVITKLTPWTWDDKALGWIIKALRAIGLQKKTD